MSKRKPYWLADGSHIPDIEPHTKAKHQILEDYIKNWIITLCGNNIGRKKTVTIVDGFCGGGAYSDPENSSQLWPGSPIRIIEMVGNGLEFVKSQKGKPEYDLDVRFIFIDDKQDHIDCLKLQMNRFGFGHLVENPGICTFVCQEFELIAERLIDEVSKRKGSSFFFLDPFGYTDVSMSTIRNIMALGTSEVIYTFMIDFIKRFLSERTKSHKNAFSNILEADGYFTRQSEGNSIEEQDYLRNEVLRLFRNKGGARFVYSFALLSKRIIVEYYLVHLANSPSAQRVIKNSLWTHNNMGIFYGFKGCVNGLGFSTPEYFARKSLVFDIKTENERASIENLNSELMPMIFENKDGISFDSLHTKTMQTNPSTIYHYMSYLDEQREVKEIEVFRNGKITKARKLRPGDIIVKSRQQTLFDLKTFIS